MLCSGSNYRDHNKEKANTPISGKEPEFFVKTADCVIGPEEKIILDERRLVEDNVKVGDSLNLFGSRQYKIVGVFSPPSGARIKMSLGAMQEALEAPGKCTYILVKLKDGAVADRAAVQEVQLAIAANQRRPVASLTKIATAVVTRAGSRP